MEQFISSTVLKLVETQTVSMGIDAKILCVMSKNNTSIELFSLDKKGDAEKRTFEVMPSNRVLSNLPADKRRKYVGSAESYGMVWHVFEILSN